MRISQVLICNDYIGLRYHRTHQRPLAVPVCYQSTPRAYCEDQSAGATPAWFRPNTSPCVLLYGACFSVQSRCFPRFSALYIYLCLTLTVHLYMSPYESLLYRTLSAHFWPPEFPPKQNAKAVHGYPFKKEENMCAHGRIDQLVTHRKINVDRRENESLCARDELEATVALHETGHVREPPRIDVEVLVRLTSKRQDERAAFFARETDASYQGDIYFSYCILE